MYAVPTNWGHCLAGKNNESYPRSQLYAAPTICVCDFSATEASAASPTIADLAKTIGSLRDAAAPAPSLSEGIALLSKFATNVDDSQVQRVQEAIASLQKGMDAAAEAAAPSVKSLVGAIDATVGGSSEESNAPVLGDATSVPIPAPASAPGADMTAAEAAAATAALLPTVSFPSS